MACASDVELVNLRGGLIVPVAAVVLALDLESRGCWFEREGDSLLVGPPNRVTNEDRIAIRELKPHLVALIDYVDRVAVQ
jgi:hypothetical protein